MPEPRHIHVTIDGDYFRAQRALRDTAQAIAALDGRPVTIEGIPMFERFTDRARRVVVLAQEEARTLHHSYIGTEHILLGLIAEGEGVAAKVLIERKIDLEEARKRVEEIIGQGQQSPPTGHIPFTPRGKKVMELALREALQLGHSYIGTEHLLLALIREGDGVGAQVLTKLGLEHARVRQEVLQLLHGYTGSAPRRYDYPVSGVAATATVPPHSEDGCPKCPGTEVSTAYRVEVTFQAVPGAGLVREHLRRECGTCGYVWKQACRPAGGAS